MIKIALTVSICFVTLLPGWADVSLPSLFSDHMILQRDKHNYVWGWADAGEKVTVSFNRTTKSTSALDNGTWLVQLPPAPLGDPHTMTVQGNNTITISDVLMGDVWVCSGQSNMGWPVSRSNDAETEIANAKYPKLRYFHVPLTVALTEQSDVAGQWVYTTPEVAANFSAVAYFFGRALHKDLDVPIGLIGTAWGGTAIESWMSQSATEISTTFDELNQDWMPDIKAQGDTLAKYYDRSISPRPERPEAKRGVGNAPNVPSFNYNAMLAPLWRYGIKGAIWYQGESNAGRAYQYRDLMKTMITDWRAQFGQGDFPFFIVQLANYRAKVAEPGPSDWAELREAQLMATELRNVGMATIIDIGKADDIHPTNKQDVGLRLAQSALKIAYEQRVVPSGPTYKNHIARKGRVTLYFNNIGGGLTTPDGTPLTGFAVAGEDGKFYWAEAEIKGKRIVVSSDTVPAPIAVRYGWANNPDCNLYNEAGLPASPFRTDDWQLTTYNKK
ncbi:MAG TPA: sialate O-acetylesterase [Candidatus Hydrogenedentes bacterium]|nr:sialate O-acetylesterase [Candidatus Hydrogenedentota bacterium]